MYLVIAEKPSVSQALAKVLKADKKGDGYLSGPDCVVSWCLGHLAEYVPPEVYDSRYRKWEFSDLPILPKEWQLTVKQEKKGQYTVLKKLLNRKDLEYVINACDAGREGELIFRRVYELSGSRLPVKRLWISSMEEEAIREGFDHLKEGSVYANLCAASVCRAKADWLIGINATRAFTTRYHKRMTVGRVQTPTLAMLVDRQEKMEHFVKETYYRVSLEKDGFCAVSENIREETEAVALAEKCRGKTAVVSGMEKTRKKISPPKLYDLTTLQREANRIFGYTAQETLKELQELYEAKLVTYPRTDSQYITDDMEQTALEVVEMLSENLPFLADIMVGRNTGRIINNQKVSDHHALLPTKEAFRQKAQKLSGKQKDLFWLIGQRLAQAVSGECIQEETAVTVSCEGHEFRLKGKRLIQPGFREIESVFRKSVQRNASVDSEQETVFLPDDLSEGMELSELSVNVSQHDTTPPKAYTEDTLLAAMETAGSQDFEKETEKKGLGTPATRASMIEKLVSSGYVERKGKQLLPTADGRELISVLPDCLKSASMTAEWENKLLLMEKGALAADRFLQEIEELVETMTDGCRSIPEGELHSLPSKECVGNCPLCGAPVQEGKMNFYCSSRDCSFSLWKENRYLSGMRKRINRKMAAELLEHGKTHVKDLYSRKTGKTFAADLLMKMEEKRVSFCLEFPKKNK